MKTPTYKSSLLSRIEISHQLERMLNSPDFIATPQQTNLLVFVVKQVLDGRADSINGYTVATEVFGRGPGFDQNVDPAVSIQAGRLRRAIERYYLTGGINDPMRIDIPKGTYVPTFVEQQPGNQFVAAEQDSSRADSLSWPTLVVHPLTNLTAAADDDFLTVGLTSELTHALSHYPEIRILEAHQPHSLLSPPVINPDFIIDGHIRRDRSDINVTIRLCDAKTGQHIWTRKYQGDFDVAGKISFQEDVAAEIALRLADGNAVIPRHLSILSKDKVFQDLTTYEAMLRYWEYDTLRSRQSYVRAVKALDHSVKRDPDYSQAWSLLANLYADNYGLEIANLPVSLEKALECAWKGTHLDPASRRSRATIAYIRLLENKLPDARSEVETAHSLSSTSLAYLDVLGWLTCLTGEWERGVHYIKKAMMLTPYYRPWVGQALCLDCFRLGDYEKAYRETLSFNLPDIHWDPLLKAAACGHLGKIEEGRLRIRNLLALKPDFARGGRILIGRYVKSKDIIDRITTGLAEVGLNIDP